MADDIGISSETLRERGASAEEVAETLRTVQDSRPMMSQRVDESSDAPLTSDIDEWADNPDQLDFPGVDTGPQFREENPNFDLDGFLDTFW